MRARAKKGEALLPCPLCLGDGRVDTITMDFSNPDPDSEVLGVKSCPECDGNGVVATSPKRPAPGAAKRRRRKV